MASGPVFACGNLGGAALPWIVGEVSTRSGSLRLALLVPTVSVLAMLIFYIVNSPARENPAMVRA